MNRRTLAVRYTVVTAFLITSNVASFNCWNFVRDGAVHFLCLAIWVMAGAALGLSQVVFVIAAFRMKRDGTASPGGVGRLDPIRTLVLTIAVVILLVIAVLLYAITHAPS